MDGNSSSLDIYNGTGGSDTTDRWGWYIRVTVTHVIVAVGVVANCFTFILMKSPRLRFKSYSQYLSALAVFDSLVLVSQEVYVVDEILTKSFDQPGVFYEFSDLACKIFTYADTVCNLMSSWLIVSMAIERMCVVYMPFRRNIWCQQKGAVIIILTLFVVIASTQTFRLTMIENEHGGCQSKASEETLYLILHIYVYQFGLLFILPVLIVFYCNIAVILRIFSVEKATQNEDSSSTRLTAKLRKRPLYLILHIYVCQFGLLFILPVLIVFYCNIAVILRIFSVEKATQNEDSSSTRLTGSSRRRSKTTRLMVAISFVYILTSLPIVAFTITMHAIAKTMTLVQMARHMVRAMPWFHFLQTVANVNYASNFFIYILSGKKFRIEFRRIFKHRRYNSSIFGGSSRTRDEIIMM